MYIYYVFGFFDIDFGCYNLIKMRRIGLVVIIIFILVEDIEMNRYEIYFFNILYIFCI